MSNYIQLVDEEVITYPCPIRNAGLANIRQHKRPEATSLSLKAISRWAVCRTTMESFDRDQPNLFGWSVSQKLAVNGNLIWSTWM